MIQIAKTNIPQFAYIKLDGYTGATNFYLSITNEITNYKVSFITSAPQLTNGRYTKCPIPMPSWYKESTYEGYEGTDAEIYNVYEQ